LGVQSRQIASSSRSAFANLPEGFSSNAKPLGVSSSANVSGRPLSMTSPGVEPSKYFSTRLAYGCLKTSSGRL